MNDARYEIRGGAGPYEAAAIAAAIAHVMAEQLAAAATPPKGPRQSSWVLAALADDQDGEERPMDRGGSPEEL